MQSNIRLMSALMRGVWFLEPTYAEAQMPLIERLLAGGGLGLMPESARGDVQRENAEARAANGPTVYAVAPSAATGGTFNASPYRSYDSAPLGSVAVIPARDVVMREDFCGDIGTDTRTQLLLAAGAHPNIKAVVIDINSPGGEASGLASFFDAVRAVDKVKPVYGFVNDGMAASAGYYYAAGCREIFVSHAHCGVGSIGCVLFLTDTSERDKAQGVKRIAVYAPQSTDKNKDFSEAVAGKPELLREGMLKSWCADFISSVQEGRGDRLKPESAGKHLNGKMYFDAAESQALGLIDGVKSFQELIQYALDQAGTPAAEATDPNTSATELEDSTATPQPNFSNSEMSHVRLTALLGLSAALVVTSEGSHLQPTHLDAIEGALAAGATAQEALTAAQASATTHATDLKAATDEVATLKATLATYAGVPAAAAAAPVVVTERQPAAAPVETAVVDPYLQMVLQQKAELGISNA